jgi:uncharacterized protein (TIGR03083 family)
MFTGRRIVIGVDLLAMIADERRGIADLIDSLSAQQLDTPSLCDQWSVRQVAGHLLAAIATPRWSLGLMLVRSGFNVHQANARVAAQMARRPASDLAAGLRDHAENPFRPPVVGYPGQLTDLQVHGQDIRRPLGLPHHLNPDRMRISLDFLVGGRAPGFVPKGRPIGLRFEAPDLDWAYGSGPVVRGAAEALMLALTGRAVVLAELDGEGTAVLRDRLAR